MRIAHYCMDNREHVFKGNNLDAIRCPYCDGLVNVMTVSNEVYVKLPKYREIRKSNTNINVSVILQNVLNRKDISGYKHQDLSNDQIRMIESILNYHKQYNKPICSCDIERVLELEGM